MMWKFPMRRFYAYAVDWVLSGLLIGFPEVLIFALVTHSSDMFSDLYVFSTLGYSNMFAYICCILSLMIFIVYYIVIPWKIWPGQTPGKKLFKLQCETSLGNKVELKQLVIRAIPGLLLIEGVSTITTRYIIQTLTLVSGFYIESYVFIVMYLLTMFSAVMVVITKNHLAIHDYLAGTRVVEIEDSD